ncbi:MAG: OmpA family protein [Candidatus Nanoarchaeia archaeon]
MTKILSRIALCAMLAATVALYSGCKSTSSETGEGTNDIGAIGGPGGAGADGLTPGAFGAPGAGVPRNPDEWTPIPGVSLPTVYFAYDQSTIGTSEFPKIEKAAEHLKSNPDHCLIIEGHCDERGSLEYNRALGERRAIAIKDALLSMGIPDNRMKTISYGEEKPAVQGSDENAWSKNRRGEMIPAK